MPMITNTEFKASLRMLGMSQADFARFIGKPVTTINRWAAGRFPVPLEVERLLCIMRDYQPIYDDFGEVSLSEHIERGEALHGLEPADVLGVSHHVAATDLRAVTKAYRALMKRYHPDLGGDTATAQRIVAAYYAIKATHAKR